MNYFEFHVGDYLTATPHLSLAEHGAYVMMLQHFYASEKALPADRKMLWRVLRAETKAEREAVESVVRQFWEEREDGLHNRRADEVLIEYTEWVAKQKANGGKGGRPKRTDGKPNGNPSVSFGLTQSKPCGGDSHLPPPTTHYPEKEPEKNPSAAAPPTRTPKPPSKRATEPPWFTELRAVYPKRAGDQGWNRALRAAHARMAEGHTPAEMLDGAARYAEFVRATGKTGTEFVKQAASFLGPDKPFLLPWEPPATVADVRFAKNLDAVAEFMRNTDPENLDAAV